MKIRISTMLLISFATGTFFFTFFTSDRSIENLLLSLFVAFLYTSVFTFGNGLLNDFLNTKYSWIEDTKTRITTGIIATILVNVVLVLGCNYVNFIWLQKANPAQFLSGSMGTINWLIINIALLISAILHAKSFMDEWKKASKKEIVEQKFIAKSANAQFESLKNQLDPHFLFNSLNVLSSLIDENPSQAQRFTASMSKIYRYVLEQKDKELITVEEEIEFAKTYCELLKTRFEDSVNFEFQVEENMLKKFVVPLSLQLLLENCIKHNFATSGKPLFIKIYSENGYLLIENNLQQREQMKESAGIGLSNIVQRYSLLSKLNVSIEKSNEFFRVKIPILTNKISNMKIQKNSDAIAYQNAAERVQELKGFYSNLTSYCLVIPTLIFINLFTSSNYLWFWWPMFGWGIGLGMHALKTFGVGKDWEEKQIQKILNKKQ
ncbi:2TM domain-containing protein [Frigoriflavimonas asaccharolytica]|uniref:Histidine kinase n=1 Tax=Frigoriflavimonas asaccharolytica TaxID=2735899 RepID=A0A8J8G935_9FLAO|nr:2TM domain-containing protein [Frigoriflavimonas asaccharolytica]NRS93383.1 hypothetical protein [Frigoriflavimonas asaccharolytica]